LQHAIGALYNAHACASGALTFGTASEGDATN